MKYIFILFTLASLISCQNKTENIETQNPDNAQSDSTSSSFVMYEMSEMASLMEQMFVENKRLRTRIIENDTLGEMPNYFDGILTKKLTDSTDFDQFYVDHAKMFLENQKNIYNNPTQAKEKFNASVDACIKCHEVKCGGPIQRIKKLYIP
nr:hypothetical protein [uncultured Flavobacterium sp.]